MKRNIVHVAAAPPKEGHNSFEVFAVASDGTLWKKSEYPGSSSAHLPWFQILDLPDDGHQPLGMLPSNRT
ncbi:MAG: hypothetical protein ACTIKR_11545 [Advenella sp.]|uniref:hypothetical protein n=1 Tax=unclassified Advenella TaxID=2685285 RepID=UPI001865DF76|nr:hypothetical protein [Advenella sp. FME57]